MAEIRDKQTSNSQSQDDVIKIPDVFELWKDIYFKSEEYWAKAVKDTISSKSFIEMVDKIRDQYLSVHNMSKQTWDKHLANQPWPTKNDIARLSELIIGVEDKIDDIDQEIVYSLNRLVTSLDVLTQTQIEFKEEMVNLNNSINSLSKKIDNCNKKVNVLSREFKSSVSDKDIND